VIKKTSDIEISNEIGRIFKGSNLLEYKSPADHLNIDTFFKGLAYACLYKAGGSRTNEIGADDISLSFVRENMPHKLFKILREMGYTIDNTYPGIYYVYGVMVFAIQVLVTGELDPDEHIWLSSLTENLASDNAEKIILKTQTLSWKEDQENADSVLQVVVSKNKDLFRKKKEAAENMCEALRELMQPEIDREIAEAVDAAVAEKDAKLKKQEEEIRLLKEQLAVANCK
jgi:hypothetical protein